ncbi:unnamed protein product [Blepharisma stoltei]|uniref:D-aminoacyl-tRNA deacylase n=1 Tax=Blepharisma stoltei TaxID=1481888 RepID=A0AAU9JL30_9CILI|nr:unnamed protein product [Blepharisma stoltei]
MRLVIQRVLSGSVTSEGVVTGAIGPGIMVLLGISRDDTEEITRQMARKLLNIRIWADGDKAWTLNVMQKNYEVLVVSQFTLYAVMKGNRPDFHNAMANEDARNLYELFVQELRNVYGPEKIQTGAFGQYMNISLLNDGPVTINIESKSNSQ